LDPEPIGQLQSTTIRSLIVGIIAVLTTFGVKVAVSDQQTQAIVEGIGAAVTIGSMLFAWWGRVKATRVIRPPGDEARPEDHVAKAICWILIGVGLGGCGAGCAATGGASPAAQVAAARQTYTATLNATTDAINAGLIRDPAILRGILAARHATEGALDGADNAADGVDPTGVGFDQWMQIVRDALAAYLKSTNRVAPTTRPAAAARHATILQEMSPWKKPSSPSSFWTRQRELKLWWMRGTPRDPAACSRPSTAPRSAPPSRRQWCATTRRSTTPWVRAARREA